MGVDHAESGGSSAAGSVILSRGVLVCTVVRMTRKKNSKWKSLDGLIKHLKAQAKKIVAAKEVVPEDIADDPKAVMEWLRGERKRERRRKKWR